MAHGIRDAAVVADRVVLAGERVQVRVPGERAAERPAKRAVALLLQVPGQLDGEAARLH